MNKISKVIHYCWFGRNPLPESAKKCIASWRKFMPDYEIIEWNEDNYDVNKIPYTAEAYAAKKYAFVSDYARFDILYQHGGLYFDTDVEVIKPFYDIVANGSFMGFEVDATTSQCGSVAPGLGLGVNPGLGLYKEILDYYAELHYTENGVIVENGTIVDHTTKIFMRHGLVVKPGIQEVAGIIIYPTEYFCPLDYLTGRMRKTKNTHSIHWYAKTWINNYGPIRTVFTQWFHRIFGVNSFSRLKKLIKRV
jgi:hypothetical protein